MCRETQPPVARSAHIASFAGGVRYAILAAMILVFGSNHRATGDESMETLVDVTGDPIADMTPLWAEPAVVPVSFCEPCVPAEAKPTTLNIGEFTLRPYGTVWSDLVYATSRTVPGRFALWVASEEDQGEPALELDARRSRIGLEVAGPQIDWCGGMDTGARFEVDFLGNFTTDNQPDVRLRHVYWEAKNDRNRVLGGQTWDVVSPLIPNTVNFSISWAAGNVGFRRNQFRWERYISSGATTWTLQAAIAQNVIQDLATGFSSTGVTRETGDWPMIQARSAVTFDDIAVGGNTMILGVSGHIGETGFDFATGHPANPALGPEDDVRLRTWSFNAEARVPLTQRWSVQGEFFTGSNLSNILGGIAQGVCPCLRVPIRSTGGWGELTYAWSPKLSSHVGYSIDDPNDNDSLIGRTKNDVIYANCIYRVSDRLTTGLEVSSWKTEYHNRTDEPGFTFVDAPTAPGEAVLVDWTVRYTF
ncbi:hypothetical protein V7x_30410 [Crateriforma conspicua]|uniref:Porin n=2 Tax=Planctomycetaceae TaxID=126 RepID=A0A5C6FWU1_9PLAN|nr:hypothetical protein V7x_30410 [Crateriforma conspicua]